MNNELFFEPKTTQYGSHMVMSNVYKQSKKKYINIDTKFREEYNYSQLSNYNITLPERITDVKSIKVVSVEIPMSFYNISAALGNNYFQFKDETNGGSYMIILPDGNYTIDGLATQINSWIDASYNIGTVKLSMNLSPPDGSNFTNKTNAQFVGEENNIIFTINFAVNLDGTPDKFNFKSKLGWLLGFRNPTYKFANSTITSEAMIDINGPRYLYLAIEEFNKGNQYSFIPELYKSLIDKNIIARIALNRTVYNFGTILPLNNFLGLLSDTRSYTDKIDLLKLNVKLLNENGAVMNLNGMDFSFCLEITHE